MAASLLIALIVAALAAAVASQLMWRKGRARLEVAEGRRTLGAMRWREFSQFVITALQAQGFEANPLATTGNARHHADHLLTRDGRSWLLSCRQAADYVLNEKELADMSREVRRREAAGGIVATLGVIDPAARRNAGDIELLDTDALWPLISPLLPAGLHEHIADRTKAHLRRNVILLWAGALGLGALAGVGVGLMRPKPDASDIPVAAAPKAPAAQPVPAGKPAPAVPAPVAATVAPAEGSPEDLRQRQALIDALSALPGVDRALWSTRSTLIVYTADGAPDQHDPVCGVVKGFDALRASRVQMQATGTESGAAGAVRFFHCSLY